MYSLDPLCEGIDGRDFPLCGKYYEPRVSYADFEKRVKSYIATHPKRITMVQMMIKAGLNLF